MRFDLIQSVSLGGDPDAPNDDRAGTRDRLAWVIDGATDLGPPGLVGARGGAAWLADEATAAMSASEGAPLSAILTALATRMAARFAAARTRAPLGRWELPIAALLAARLEENALEFGWLGDCTALLRCDGAVLRFGLAATLREGETAQAKNLAAHGLGKVKGREGPLIDSLRASRERPRGGIVGVEGGNGNAEIQRVTCAPGDELLLMTDGFAALADSYGTLTESELMAALPKQGLASLAVELRRIEAGDAACLRYPRFKTSDDATALWLRVGE